MSDKPEIGKYKHSRLTTDARAELDKMTSVFEDLINEIIKLEKAGAKNTGALNQAVVKLVKHHTKTVKHVNAIWDLIKNADQPASIDAQLSAIAERLEAHDEVIRLVRQMLQDREQAELFGESAK